MLQDVKKAMTPARRRLVVDSLRVDWKLSIGRVYSAIRAVRATYHYKSHRPDRLPLNSWIKEIAETRVCYPKSIRVDQDREFVAKDLDLCAYRGGVILDINRPGKPTDNAFIEFLNGKFRAERPNAHWFMTLNEMRRICEEGRRDLKEVRLHSAIDNKTPITPMNSSGQHGPV